MPPCHRKASSAGQQSARCDFSGGRCAVTADSRFGPHGGGPSRFRIPWRARSAGQQSRNDGWKMHLIFEVPQSALGMDYPGLEAGSAGPGGRDPRPRDCRVGFRERGVGLGAGHPRPRDHTTGP